jgi:flavocytochrome c
MNRPAPSRIPRPGKEGNVMFDEEYEVVVVGSGFAGLAAAIEAREAGRSVLIIEKMRVPGGNSAISGGMFAVVGSPLQESAGVQDSPALLAADMVRAGQGLNQPDLVRTVAEHSLEAFLWTRDHLGVAFDDALIHGGGHSLPRTHITPGCSGAAIIQAMLVRCRELGIPLRMQCALEDLVRDRDGRVAGLAVRDGYIFPQPGSGARIRIRATRGVVLASGGFSQDVAFRSALNPRLDATIDTTNHPGATAEALVSALRAGALPVHLSWIQMGPWTSRDEEGWGVGSMFTVLVGFPHGIMVDATTGRRFVNELTDRLARFRHIAMEGRDPMVIVGEEAALRYPSLTQCLKRKVVWKYDTLEALALDQGIDAAPLAETLAAYNEAAGRGVDPVFGKPVKAESRYQIRPPYYLARLKPKVHYCNGGILINPGAQVLDAGTQGPIPGLYAAGEVTGGVNGACRIQGVAICECIVFGRIAGRGAAEG